MKSITLVILLIICTTTYALSCATTDDKEPLEQPLNGLVPDEFIEKIKKLPSVEGDGSGLCRVALAINYVEKTLYVIFTKQLFFSKLEDQDILIDIIVDGSEADDFGSSYNLQYACSDDECEKNFVIQHFNWLFNADHPELSNQLMPFILGNGEESGE
jgi:hypothetical protein